MLNWKTIAGFALALYLVAVESALRVGEDEQIVITRFGEPVGDVITEPGWTFKPLLVDAVHRFAKGPLPYHGDGFQLSMPGGSALLLNVAGEWRVTDALAFYQQCQDESRARARLGDVFRQALEELMAAGNPAELAAILGSAAAVGEELSIRDARYEQIREEIVARAQLQILEWGIEILSIEVTAAEPRHEAEAPERAGETQHDGDPISR